MKCVRLILLVVSFMSLGQYLFSQEAEASLRSVFDTSMVESFIRIERSRKRKI